MMLSAKQCNFIDSNLASFVLGAGSIFAKLIPLPAHQIIFARTSFAFITVVLYMLYKRQRFVFKTKKDFGLSVFFSLLATAHWVSFFYAIQLTTVSIGIIALFTYPIWSLFIESIFQKTRLKAQDLGCVSIVLLGIYLILPDQGIFQTDNLGVLMGILSAIFLALRNVMCKPMLHREPPILIMGVHFLVASLVLCPVSIPHVFSLSLFHSMLLLISGIFFTGLSHVLYLKSLTHLKASTVAIISCVQPVYGTLAAWVFLKEIPTLYTWIGGGLVLGVVVLETLRHARP